MIPIIEMAEVQNFIEKYKSRHRQISLKVHSVVREILGSVEQKGDESLYEYSLQFDNADLKQLGLVVPEDEIEEAVRSTPPDFLSILNRSAENIRKYHKKTKQTSWLSWEEDGVILGQRVTPIRRIGIYVPGGQAAYPSSLIMAAVPAQVAEVEEIAIVTPPNRDGKIHPTILSAAHVLGIEEIYRIGGAQAVAALAFGTASVHRVDKIVGPGNSYVAEAKRQVFGLVDIDMIAGPSEVVILADQTAEPAYIASDLLAQAEHDTLASSLCVTSDTGLAEATREAVIKQGTALPRKRIFQSALADWGGILLVENMSRGIELVNELAPEHLELHVANPWEILGGIQNAGAIFLGSYSPETVGDYWAGPNHILPTNRTARFSSPLGTEDFQKKSSLIQYPKEALGKNAQAIITFAEKEGLDGHAQAVRQRTG
jgi:histidinol dehydrogenase